MKSITITNWQHTPPTERVISVGDSVRWLQGGINRYMHGKIIDITENKDNLNLSKVKIETESGKIVYTKAVYVYFNSFLK